MKRLAVLMACVVAAACLGQAAGKGWPLPAAGADAPAAAAAATATAVTAPAAHTSRLALPAAAASLLAAPTALQFPSDSAALHHFYRQLAHWQTTGQGRINILHIGASHVQAGVLTQRLRWHFALLGDTAALPPRGLIFPYAAARTNNPVNFKVSSQGQWKATRNVNKKHDLELGMSGIAISTHDPMARLSVKVNGDSRLHYTFDCLRLLSGESSPHFQPLIDDSIAGSYDAATQSWSFVLPREQESFTLSFAAPTQAQTTTTPTDALSGASTASGTQLVSDYFQLNGIILDNSRPGIVYHAIGVNGASVGDYLRCPHFQRDLQWLQPNLVIFGIGINDASKPDFDAKDFVSRYDSLIACIQSVNPEVSMIFMTNNDSYIARKKPNDKAIEAQTAFHELARRHHAALWDVFQFMGGLGSARQWRDQAYMKADLIHFTTTGYELLGDCLFQAIMQDYRRYYQTGQADPNKPTE